MKTCTIDLKKFKKKNGEYEGIVVFDKKQKHAYGNDGAMSNIIDELTERAITALDCPVELEEKLCDVIYRMTSGNKYKLTIDNGKLKVEKS